MTERATSAMTAWPPVIPEQQSPAADVLAGRLAAWLLGHPPGWRLPRLSELGRKFSAGPSEISAAVADLARRRLVRQLADGQFYRASPADYLITFENLPGIGAHIDPMGAAITRAGRRISRQPVPEGIRQALGLATGTPAHSIHCSWAIDSSPAAVSTTYMPGELPAVPFLEEDFPGPLEVLDSAAPARAAGTPVIRPGTVHLEVQPPPSRIARHLRLSQGESAITVTVMFTHAPSGSAAALTVAVLRPDLFRVSIESSPPQPSTRPVHDWAHTVLDQDLP
jgi:DNA-binding GntR family transcriptional regulator